MSAMHGMALVQRYGGLVVALMALATMWTLASTDLVWQRMGRPRETYPELFYAAFGLPAALIAVVAGLFTAWKYRAEKPNTWQQAIAHWISAAALAVCGLLIFDAVFLLR